MDPYIRRESFQRRLRVGPLAPFLDSYAAELSRLGHAHDTGRRQLHAVTRLSRGMGRRGIRPADLDEGTAERFLRRRRRTGT